MARKKKDTPPQQRRDYEAHKGRAVKQSRKQALEGREIGAIPDVVDPARKAAAERDFRLFCDTYSPQIFDLPWSDDHLKVIAQIEETVLSGGLYAVAMPRGAGKSSLCEHACIWAVLYGHRNFVALIGSDEGHATQMLKSIKAELDGNPDLADDFPEVCYPISRLDGISNRCSGQLCQGKRTYIGWTGEEVVLPTIAGSQASGAIIMVGGLTGGIRGMKYKRHDGKSVRPSLVVLDDPQTDASSRSPSQCITRERILAGAVLGMAGPGKKISGIMPCTVISPGDMADAILNRDRHPEWNGTRTKMVYSFPKSEKLWEDYHRIRDESLKAGHAGREATTFYIEHRAEMDEGAIVAWPARFEPDEISAIQSAMNLKFRDPRAFAAEYQNEPLPEDDARADLLTADQVAAKLNRYPRGRVPMSATRLTAFIDVHASVLYYCVAAWEENFSGYILDYGTYPDQKRPYFTLNDAKYTLESVTKIAGLEGQIYAGLETLTAALIGHEWKRDDGATMRIERCMIDGNWGPQTDLIYQFCRQSAFASVIMPSHGRGIKSSDRPMREWVKKPGDRVGLNWRIPGTQGKRALRKVMFDTNYWKTFLHTRLNVAMGNAGCLSLFGDKPDIHRMFADHIVAEYPVPTRREGSNRVVDEWKWPLTRPDNHFLDTAVGCAVAASMQGVSLPETTIAAPPKKHRVTFADLRARQSGQRPPS